MNRRKIIEFYAHLAGILTVINTLFVVAMSGLAVYIADEASSGDGLEINVLEFVFIMGMFLIFFHLLVGILGMIRKSVGTIRMTEILSILTLALSVAFTYACGYILYKYPEVLEDLYTLTIILIGVGVGIVSVIYAFAAHRCTRKVAWFSKDKAKVVTTIQATTEEELKSIKNNALLFTFTILTLSAGFFSFYSAYQIKQYAAIQGIEVPFQQPVFMIIFIIVCVLAAVLLVSVVVSLIGRKINPKYLLIIAVSALSLMALYIIVSVTMFNTIFVKVNAPDITYTVFAIVLIIISLLPFRSLFKEWKLSLKQD